MTGRVRVPPFTTTSDCHDLRPITQLSQQGPLAQWPELLPRLSAMLDAQRSAPTAQEGALWVLRKLFAGGASTPLSAAPSQPLDALVPQVGEMG